MVKYTSIYRSIHISRAQGERKDGDVIRIFRGLHGLLGCSAAGHSGDAPEVGFLNLGLSNPAVTKATVGGVPPFSLVCLSHSHE